MKVQLPVRWSDHKKLDKDVEQLKRLLEGEESPESEVEYMFGSVVLDTKDIRAYNDLDEDHCILRTYFNDSYCIALGLDNLKSIMAELTGENVVVIQKVELKPTGKKKRPRKGDGSISPEDDLII